MFDALGDRMKGYENVNRTYLISKSPVIARLNGRSFHTYTKGFKRPYDLIFIKAMQKTAKNLCENIGNCRLAYVQSDEISILMTDYDNLNTQPWFGNNVQKICSVTASMATLFFYHNLEDIIQDYESNENAIKKLKKASQIEVLRKAIKETYGYRGDEEWFEDYFAQIKNIFRNRNAFFDCRCFNLSREEVTNYFIWRQKDCQRNSVYCAASSCLFSHKYLHGKSCNEVKQIMINECGIDWNGSPNYVKNGTCIVKKEHPVASITDTGEIQEVIRHAWKIDPNIPIFTEQRDYIDQFVIKTVDN